jgi:4-carboxymuconolactone decarboxylase
MKIVQQTRLIFILISLILISVTDTKAQEKNNTKNFKMSTFTEKGVAAPKDYFTGTVWVNMNVKPEEGYNINMGTITFEPKARTNWHTHTSGQILFVIEGIGYYQEKGKPIQLIQKGDVVKIPKNAVHWHGASHGSSMRHIALVPDFDKDKTEWLQAVSDEDYDSYQPASKQ